MKAWHWTSVSQFGGKKSCTPDPPVQTNVGNNKIRGIDILLTHSFLKKKCYPDLLQEKKAILRKDTQCFRKTLFFSQLFPLFFHYLVVVSSSRFRKWFRYHILSSNISFSLMKPKKTSQEEEEEIVCTSCINFSLFFLTTKPSFSPKWTLTLSRQTEGVTCTCK